MEKACTNKSTWSPQNISAEGLSESADPSPTQRENLTADNSSMASREGTENEEAHTEPGY